MSGVSCPESMSACRIACRSESSDRSPSFPSSCQNDGDPPANPDWSRKSLSWSSSDWRLTASASSGWYLE